MKTNQRAQLGPLFAEGGGVVRRREHPELATTFDRLLRIKELTAVLPGVYAPTAVATDVAVRTAAVAAWSADAVIIGHAAARLTFWPEVKIDAVALALRVGHDFKHDGFQLQRRTIPVDWIVERNVGGGRTLRFTAPALTAVELAGELGGEPIDQALRTGQATLADMQSALDAVKGRVGNVTRRRLVWESRDTPWAESERLAHQLLRDAGVLGWTGNEKVSVNGCNYFIDICFRRPKVAIEIDGLDHQLDIATFVRDRERQNALVLAGWTVLRFTWRDLNDHPHRFVAQVRSALAAATRTHTGSQR